MNNPTYIFNAGGKKYRVQDRDLDAFARELPNATIERNGETFRAEDFARGDGKHTIPRAWNIDNSLAGQVMRNVKSSAEVTPVQRSLFPNTHGLLRNTHGLLRESREDMAEANRAIMSGEARPTFMPGVFKRNGGYVTSMGSADNIFEAKDDVEEARAIERRARLRPTVANELGKPIEEVGDKEVRESLYKKSLASTEQELENLFYDINALYEPIRAEEIRMRRSYKENQSFGDWIIDATMGASVAELPVLQGQLPNNQLEISPEWIALNNRKLMLDAAGRLYDEGQQLRQAVVNDEGFGEAFIGSLGSLLVGGDSRNDSRLIEETALKFKNGEQLNKEEEILLKALAVNAAARQEYGGDLSIWYDVGQTVGDMIPSIIEMWANPLSGFTKAAGRTAAARVAKSLIQGVGRGYGMALTTGLPDVVKGTGERMRGDATFDVADDGEILYTGQINQQAPLEAFYNSATSRMIENATEMFGAGYIGRPLSWVASKGKGTRLLGWMDNFARSRYGRQFRNFANKTKWHGPIEEFFEEMHSGIASPILTGEGSISDFFEGENLATVALSVAVPGAAFASVNTAVGINNGSFKAGAQELERMRMSEVNAVNTWSNIADRWAAVKSDLDNGSIEEVDAVLTEILNDKNLTREQKVSAFRYGINNMRYRVARGASEALNEKDKLYPMLREIYARYYTAAPTGEQALNAEAAYSRAEGAVRDVLGLGSDADIDAYIGNRSIEEVANGDGGVEEILGNYIAAKVAYEGVRDRVNYSINEEQAQSDKKIDYFTNNGGVYSTTLDGKNVFITGGDVVLLDDGKIDVDNSSEMLYYRLPDGTTKQIAAELFGDVVNVENAETLKAAGRAEIDNKWRAEFDAAELREEERKKRNTGMLFTTADQLGEHTVEVLEEGAEESKILFDGKEMSIGTEELNAWRAEAGIEVAENGQPVKTPTDSGIRQTTNEVAPIPTEKRGNVERAAYHLVPIERTMEDLYDGSLDNSEVAALINARIKEAGSDVQALDKKKPTEPQKPTMGTSKEEYLAAKAKAKVDFEKAQARWETAMQEARQRLDYYNELYRRNEEITRSAVGEVYENIQPVDVVETTPDEFIASHLPKITPESFKAETGLSNSEQLDLVGVIAGADKGGVTIEQAAESIIENYGDELRGLGFTGDMLDVRDIIIDILSQGNPRSYAKKGFEQRKQESINLQRAEIEAVAESLGFESVEEMAAYEELVVPGIIQKHRGFDENEYYNNLAENYEYDTTRESETVGRGSELLQGEQVVDNSGERVVEERNEGGAVSNSVQGGGQNGVAQEETVNEPVGNSEQLSGSEIPNNQSVAEGDAPGNGGVSKAELQDARAFAEAYSLNTVEAYQAYLDRYPEGAYRDGARNGIWTLEGTEEANSEAIERAMDVIAQAPSGVVGNNSANALQNGNNELNLQKENESDNESNQNDIPIGGQVSQPVPQGEYGTQTSQVSGAQEVAARLRERIESAQGDSKSGLREVENRVTREFAQENGLWIENETELGTPFPSGDEHNNYIDVENQVVYKVNNRMHTPSILDLLDRIEQHNKYFPDSKYSLVGFTSVSKNGDVLPVFAQDFVSDARMASTQEIDAYMGTLGFTRVGNGRYSNGEVIINDLHPRNVLADADGDIYVVDAEFEQAEIAENGGEKKSSIIEEAEAEYRNNPLHGVQFSIDADAYNNEDVTFGESEQSTEGGALVSYQDVIYKGQTIGWVKETQSGRMFAPMVTSFYVPLENATEEDKRSPHYFEGEEDYMRFATLQQMVDYINSKPQQGEIQEPRSVEEMLDNGDKRITSYNSRGEVATVAIERDGKVVSVDSYDEGVLFEHTEYDGNGKATLVTRYDKSGNVVGTQKYVNGIESKAFVKETMRTAPLRARAEKWMKDTGVPVRLIGIGEDITNSAARRAIEAGEKVTGWIDNDEVVLYLPNIRNAKEIDDTFVHEVVAHKGLKALMGEDFDALCDKVWDMMSEEQRAYYLGYPGVNGDTRKAADEFMAHLAEGVDLTDADKTIWNWIVDAVRALLAKSGFKLSNRDIESLIKASYANLRSTEQRAESKEGALFRTTFHGSGAQFDRFDHSFMGTGEGAQAFGWGTYVTEVEGIGRTYAKTMRDKAISDKHIENAIINNLARQVLASNNGDKNAALEELRNLLNESWSDKKRVKAEIKIIETGKFLPETKVKANLYTVEIPDDNGSNYLHWEDVVPDEVIDNLWDKLRNTYGEDVALNVSPKYGQDGEHLYKKLSRGIGGDKQASLFLNDMGFVGISYPANATTGGRADGARNYVIFNENDAQIKDRTMFRIAEVQAIEEADKVFNEELDAFKEKSHKGLLHLGSPMRILLSAGVNAEELTLSPTVLFKHLKKQGLTTDDLKGLAKAIQTPILVYEHGENYPNIVVVTELDVKGGKLSIALELDDAGNVVEVSNVSSVHSKDAVKELERLSVLDEETLNRNLRWVEKEKVSEWLGLPYEEERQDANPKLISVANVINNFENPTVESENSSENPQDAESDIRFRKKESERRQEKRRINDAIDTAAGFITVGGKKQATKNRLKKEAERKQLAKEMYSSVLKGDFNDVTLSQIDKFIEDATPANPFGRRISQRLPQRMERALRQGARTNAVDALFSRICESTVPANERFSEAGRREIEERKKELLKGWAIATGNWHTDLKEFTDDTEPIGEGKDSKVYMSKDGNSVIKASKGKPFGKKFRPDIDNIPLFNDVFKNSRYEILGYGEIDGQFVRILKQDFIDFAESTPLTPEERKEYMGKLGFKPLNKDYTAFSNGEIVIADLQKSNIVKDAAGNISVIDADAKLHTKDVGGDYTYPPVEEDLPEQETRFRFIGKKGAANLDNAEEVTTRLDNLSVAREMESAGKDAKAVKLATGWERGADGKWRYETEDTKVKDTINIEGNEFKRREEDMLWTSGLLKDVIDAPGLFEAYPELKKVRLDADPITGDYPSNGGYDPRRNMITIHADEVKYLNSILNHEIQHVIQHIEGFAKGGNEKTADYIKNKARVWAWRNALKETEKEHPELAGTTELEKVLMDEYRTEGLEKYIPTEEQRIKGFNLYVRGYDGEGYERAFYAMQNVVAGNGFATYLRLAGEVESRNVQGRMNMTPEERRSSLAEETADVAREDQIFIYDALESAMMGSRVDARMAEVAAHFEGKQLTAEQQAVVDVFGGKADNLTISVKTKDGNERRVVMRQGNEMGAGAKHSLYRHYGMNNGAITADDILLIPEILANGERVEKKRGKKTVIEYKYTDNNGVEYTVITENNKGREEFANFYTNRKASSAARKTRSEEARDTADDASEDKGSDNSSNTQEEETRFRTVEETTEGSIDDVPAQPLTLMERITNSLLEVSAKNRENLGLRADALRTFGRDMENVLKLMKAQRVYDKSTVDQLVKLAKMYFKNAQLVGEITPYEMGRILSVINNVVGRRDISANAAKLMDILLDAHNKALGNVLAKAEKVKAKKVNAAGVEVMGTLDGTGQELVETYKAAKELSVQEADELVREFENELAEADGNTRRALGIDVDADIAKAVEEYTSTDEITDDIVNGYKMARARVEGARLGLEFVENDRKAVIARLHSNGRLRVQAGCD